MARHQRASRQPDATAPLAEQQIEQSQGHTPIITA
jgi:hypothetical protein